MIENIIRGEAVVIQAAMYLVPKIVAAKPVNDIGDKTLKVLNLKLDEWIKDLTEEE